VPVRFRKFLEDLEERSKVAKTAVKPDLGRALAAVLAEGKITMEHAYAMLYVHSREAVRSLLDFIRAGRIVNNFLEEAEAMGNRKECLESFFGFLLGKSGIELNENSKQFLDEISSLNSRGMSFAKELKEKLSERFGEEKARKIMGNFYMYLRRSVFHKGKIYVIEDLNEVSIINPATNEISKTSLTEVSGDLARKLGPNLLEFITGLALIRSRSMGEFMANLDRMITEVAKSSDAAKSAIEEAIARAKFELSRWGQFFISMQDALLRLPKVVSVMVCRVLARFAATLPILGGLMSISGDFALLLAEAGERAYVEMGKIRKETLVPSQVRKVLSGVSNEVKGA